jgi:hypothetical protein
MENANVDYFASSGRRTQLARTATPIREVDTLKFHVDQKALHTPGVN